MGTATPGTNTEDGEARGRVFSERAAGPGPGRRLSPARASAARALVFERGHGGPKAYRHPPAVLPIPGVVGDLCDLTCNSKECDTMFLKIGGPQTSGPSQSAAALPSRAPLPRAPRRPPRGATSSRGWLPAASQAGALSLSPRRCRAPGPRPRHGGAAALLGLRGGDHGRL